MKRLVLENEQLHLTFLPELGGKLCSLQSASRGREHLLQPPERPWRAAGYGDSFADYDTSGWDECFPTVGVCTMDDGTELPDHGELWAVPWDVVEESSTAVTMQVAGRALPYQVRRRVTLDGARVRFDYTVSHHGEQPFSYIWSAHPLLQVEEGDRIRLPDGVQQAEVEWSSGAAVSGKVPWPGEFDRLVGSAKGRAEKLFVGPLQQGWCRLEYAAGGALTLRFDPLDLPYLGLWICQGGWPEEPGRARHFTLALEPCHAPCDRLDQAANVDQARTLAPRSEASWSVTLEVTP